MTWHRQEVLAGPYGEEGNSATALFSVQFISSDPVVLTADVCLDQMELRAKVGPRATCHVRGSRAGAWAKAWCLLIHADASLSLSHGSV